MAKKKTAKPESGSNNAEAPPVAARRRRAPGAAIDQSVTARGEATTSEEVQLAVANDTPDRMPEPPSYDEIAEAAYRRYLSRGGGHGQDFEDWLTAERDLRKR